ncbi:hypothetical protein GGH12_002322 [Coemansia sp. RSA 1822]|nr:hypothetical protein GGH12_002322 [Coemansia sp. RSA 1822]
MEAMTASASGKDQACAECNKLHELDPDFLLSLRFGPTIDETTQRRVIQYIKRVLHPPDIQPDTPGESRRKRRRRDDRYTSDRYSDSDPDNVFSRKRTAGRTVPVERNSRETDTDQTCTPAMSDMTQTASVQSVTFYTKAAGFDLDVTRVVDTTDSVSFEHGTTAIIGLTNEAAQALGNPCFNCSMPGHEMRDCPMTLDDGRIETNRAAFLAKGSGQFTGRFYAAAENEKRVSELRQKFRPGQPLSQDLRDALELETDDDVPEYIQSMYFYGYPPAYLGTNSDQDPMLAWNLSTQPAPPTPVLQVYSSVDDYSDANDTSDSKGEKDSDEQAAADNKANGSDEEGAISDGEVDAVCDGKADAVNGQPSRSGSPEPPRNIPLVKYEGLDLREFDFTSTERPGRPLRSHTPYHRRARADYHRDVYTDGYRHSTSNPAYHDRYYSESCRSRHRYRDDYYDHYQSSDPYQNSNGNSDSWDGMLEGYYRSGAHDYTTSDKYGEYKVHRDYYTQESSRGHPDYRPNSYGRSDEEVPLPPASPAPPLPQQHDEQQNDEQTSTKQTMEHKPSGKDQHNEGYDDADDGELEDGECDMSLSE